MEDAKLKQDIAEAYQNAKQRQDDKEAEETNAWRRDQELKLDFNKEYNKMISDLKSGKVKPNSYLDKEAKLDIPVKELVKMIDQSSALNKLLNKKNELIKARKYAELRGKKMKTASDLLGKEIKNDFDLGRAEKELKADDELINEYHNRIFSADEEIEEETEKKEDEETEKENEYLDIDEESDEESEEDSEEESKGDDNFYQAK